MTWTTATSTGNEDLEFRLSIEGWPYEFVTCAAMETTSSDGRIRVRGLLREGMRWSEQCDPAHGEIDAEGFTASIVDRQIDDVITTALASRPGVVAYLTSDLADTTTSGNIAVTSTSGFSNGDVVHIGTEAIEIDAPAGANLPFSVGGRGYRGTTAQKHYAGDGQYLCAAEVTSAPRTLEGRRVSLYAYGRGQTLTSSGTLIWRGVCATDARLSEDGCTWSIQLDPITRVLDQELCSDMSADDLGVRGIFVPSTAPMRIDIAEYTAATYGGAAVNNAATVYVYGFFDTQELFCEQVTSTIATAISGWTTDLLVCVSDGEDGYHFELRTDSATARWVNLAITAATEPSGLWRMYDAAGSAVETVAVSSHYYLRPDAARGAAIGVGTVPRGWFGPLTDTGYFARDPNRPSPTAAPANQLYVGGSVALTDGLILDLEMNGGHFVGPVASYSTVYRYLTVGLNGWRRYGITSGFYSRESQPTIRISRQLAFGSLADLRDQLVADAPVYANNGGAPWFTSDDVASWTTEVDAATQGYPWVKRRRWRLGQPQRLADVVAHECRMIGCFPVIDTDGKLALKRITAPAATDDSTRTINSDDILVDEMRPTWERGGLWGALNTVSIRTGYSSFDDDFRGPVYVVRNVPALAARKQPRTLDIEPRSEYEGEFSFDVDAAVSLAAPVFGLFGGDYSVVRVQVPLTCWTVLCGDFVRLTDPWLPDVDSGTRGMTTQIGLVVGREWEVARGRGTLTIVISHERIAGYTPAVLITGATNVSGNTWDLTVQTTDEGGESLFASGEDHEDHFAVSDGVVLLTRDSTAPTVRSGSIDTISATTIRVTLTAAWGGLAGATYWLRYADAASADASMRAYCYWAGTDDRVDFATPVSAFVFAP